MAGLVGRPWHTNIKLILQIPHFKQLNSSSVCSEEKSVLGDPDVAVVVEGVDLVYGKLFQVPFIVSKEFEDLFTDRAHLSVVLRVE